MQRLKNRLKSKWNKRYKSLKKQRDASLESADQLIAGKLILRGFKKLLHKIRNKKSTSMISNEPKTKSIFPDM